MSKKILITGVTGTLGKKLLTLLLTETDYHVVGLSRDEQKQRLLPQDDRFTARLGDVRDIDSIVAACGKHIDMVFHLAALKCVDTLEDNVIECMKTNLLGTQNVATVANMFGARMLFTSTDKAAYPVNAYGMSKALAERVVMEASKDNVVVRYGNVLGSRGSFLPKLVGDLLKGEAHLTSDKMTRFWMHIDSVVDFVYAAGMSEVTGLTVPKDIKASYVKDLIKSVARILKVEDYVITDVGVRPGEKFHECLSTTFEFGCGDVTSEDQRLRMTNQELDELLTPIVESIYAELLERL